MGGSMSGGGGWYGGNWPVCTLFPRRIPHKYKGCLVRNWLPWRREKKGEGGEREKKRKGKKKEEKLGQEG